MQPLDQQQPQPTEVGGLTRSSMFNSGPINLTCVSESVLFWTNGPPLRVIAGLACCLSAIGALLIIFSYACFKSLRSRARLVLVHLSLMDLGVSMMNLLGNLVHFDGYYIELVTNMDLIMDNTTSSAEQKNLVCPVYHQPNSIAIQRLCTAQAFLAHYFTYGSVLWTISLAVFIYFVIVHHRKKYAKYSLIVSYILCYGIPVALSFWLLLTDRLGYSPQNGLWCSIVLQKPGDSWTDTYAGVFGYDIWIYLTFIVVLIFFVAVKLFIRDKVCHHTISIDSFHSSFLVVTTNHKNESTMNICVYQYTVLWSSTMKLNI